MEQDESEAAVSETEEEEMKQEKEAMEETVEPVVAMPQQMMEEVAGSGATLPAGKRGKESDGDAASDEKEDVEGETWQMVQAKRQKLAEKKRKAKERKAKAKSDGVGGEEKKEQVKQAVRSGVGMTELTVDGVGDQSVLPDDIERHRAWVVSQFSLPSSMVDNIVNKQTSQVHPSLSPVYDMTHKLTDTLLQQCMSAMPTYNNPFHNAPYRTAWCAAVNRLVLSPAPLTIRSYSAAVTALSLPAGCVALAIPVSFPTNTRPASQ
jgi:hypothetical protein